MRSHEPLDRLQKGALGYAFLMLLVIALIAVTGVGRGGLLQPTPSPPIPNGGVTESAAATVTRADLVDSRIGTTLMPTSTPASGPQRLAVGPSPTPVPALITGTLSPPLPTPTTPSSASATTTPGSTVVLVQKVDALAGNTFRNASLSPDGIMGLTPTLADTFSATGLDPAAWQIVPWGTGGTAVAHDGTLTVNVAAIRTARPFVQRTLEVRARFTAGPPPYQNIAWSPDLNGPTAILVGEPPSDPAHIYARLKQAGMDDRMVKLPVTFNEDHNYGIAWEKDRIDFSIDGVLAATIDAALDSPMYAWISSATAGHTLTAAWAHVRDYDVTDGSFVSAPLDAGATVRWWGVVPDVAGTVGTSVTVQTRTSVDGVIWSAYASLDADGNVASPPGRYLRYELLLHGTPASSPMIRAVAVSRSTSP